MDEREIDAAWENGRSFSEPGGEKKKPGARIKRILLAILGTALLAGGAFTGLSWREDRLNLRAADTLFDEGWYLAAREYYLLTGRNERASLCLDYDLERQYLNARRSLELGAYDTAREQLMRIRGYKDTENLLLSCDYLETSQAMTDGELEQAWDRFKAMGYYPGVEEKLKALEPMLYERACDLALDFELEHACAIWERLGDYRDCGMLLKRAQRMTKWLQSDETRLTDPSRRFSSSDNARVYRCDAAYLVTPLKPDRDTRFFLYYPGGRNEELYVDYFLTYLDNPEPNTVAVFLRRNGVDDIEAKNTEAIELLECLAAECGVFLHDPVVAGSSLGAYPALYSAIYNLLDFGLRTRCVLCLDAGNDWIEADLTLNESQCYELAATGAELYLFDSPWIGMDRPAIRMMVNAGCPVTVVGCYNDDHAWITFDAMGMGVLHWALGDRTEPCELPIYTFRRLHKGDAW
ncbi:MAG: hypothetical protein Q4E45_10995 [Eubacteriales bacterium]|nr:hypothetical protein [Eubacteriales bacterium]